MGERPNLQTTTLDFLQSRQPGQSFTYKGIAESIESVSTNGLRGVLNMLEHNGLVVCQRSRRGPAFYRAVTLKPALTPSEIALAKVLAAWVEWWAAPPACTKTDLGMSDVGEILRGLCLVVRNGEPTQSGQALLDRARKAGVL
jgi:DNA-binding HxlR family transcriptional regulator